MVVDVEVAVLDREVVVLDGDVVEVVPEPAESPDPPLVPVEPGGLPPARAGELQTRDIAKAMPAATRGTARIRTGTTD